MSTVKAPTLCTASTFTNNNHGESLSQNKNFLYIDSFGDTDYSIRNLFEVKEFQDVKFNASTDLKAGIHQLIVTPETREEFVKAIAWKLKTVDNAMVRVHQLSNTLNYYTGSTVASKELLEQIAEFSLDFKDWNSRNNEYGISIEQACEVAKAAIALLPDTKKAIELQILQQRCNCNPYAWSKIVEGLERDFYRELEQRGINNPSTDRDEKLRLSLLGLLNESDPIKKIRKRSEICSHYRISKSEVETALKALKARTEQKECLSYEIDDLFNLKVQGLSWTIPELLPTGETVILSGSPKVGKTLLAIDAAFAIATGENSFLGHGTGDRKKVLLICPDQSLRSTRDKLIKRGFRSQDKGYIKIIPHWTIDQIQILEEQLDEYRPDVVIIDSLKRITHGSNISENSSEFADNIYSLKETIGRYNASGILIHHNNKNSDSMGVGKLRGSSAIAGAVWGTWQMEHIPRKDPNNKKKLIIDPSDPTRLFTLHARDTEGQKFKVELNPENFSWNRLDNESQEENSTYRQRILNILTMNPTGLAGREIIELLELSPDDNKRSIYNELNRMTNKRLINCSPASGDKRINIYSIVLEKIKDTPPPIPSDIKHDKYSENTDISKLENSHINSHMVEKNSHMDNEKINHDDYLNPDIERNTEIVITSTENIGGEGVTDQHTDTQNTHINTDEVDGFTALVRDAFAINDYPAIQALFEGCEHLKQPVWKRLTPEEQSAFKSYLRGVNISSSQFGSD